MSTKDTWYNNDCMCNFAYYKHHCNWKHNICISYCLWRFDRHYVGLYIKAIILHRHQPNLHSDFLPFLAWTAHYIIASNRNYLYHNGLPLTLLYSYISTIPELSVHVLNNKYWNKSKKHLSTVLYLLLLAVAFVVWLAALAQLNVFCWLLASITFEFFNNKAKSIYWPIIIVSLLLWDTCLPSSSLALVHVWFEFKTLVDMIGTQKTIMSHTNQSKNRAWTPEE